MKKLLTSISIASGLLLFGSNTVMAAGPACGEAQDDSWLDPVAVQQNVETLGYVVENLGVSEGNCYEMSAMNRDGQSVIAYIDPRSGELLQEEIAE